MWNRNEIITETAKEWSNYDIIRRKYLAKLAKYTHRHTIAYYSGFWQKPQSWQLWSIDDNDKIGFMTTINKKKIDELDLILHTPWWNIAATESIIDYLKTKFSNIRVIVPQLAMSAWTMIACSSDCILMWQHSSLWPIDPQYLWMSAHWIIEEFTKAYEEIKKDPVKSYVRQPIIQKYNPTLIWECQKSIIWARQLAEQCLRDRMLNWDSDIDKKISRILDELCDHSISLSHSRHLSINKCKEIGLKIIDLEWDQELQDLVLSVHHCFIQTLTVTSAVKIIENHLGVSYISHAS